MDLLIWALVILLMLIGLVGSVVPLLPGTTLILVAALLQKWLLPATVTWAAVAWVAAFWLLSVLADIGCTLLGTKLFGGGKWGMAGATGGALVGMFFSLPGLLLSTLLGGVLAEKVLAKRSHGQALKSGIGGALGFLFSSVAKLGCALAMLAIWLASAISLAGNG